MMKGLARWLRACGYDATWTYGIDDDELVEQARREERTILTADGPLARRPECREGRPPCLLLCNEQPPLEQAGTVLERLALPRRASRCMACGGEVHEVPKASVEDEAPPRTYAYVDRFFRCARCGRLLWRGTHWDRIEATLEAAFGPRA